MRRARVAPGEVLGVTPGALYPALHRLEGRGLIEAEWAAPGKNRRAKVYELTRAGEREPGAGRETWRRFAGAVGAILRDA
jgi:PadR family transcriptional regulator PadR